jgi:hypothetical protein
VEKFLDRPFSSRSTAEFTSPVATPEPSRRFSRAFGDGSHRIGSTNSRIPSPFAGVSADSLSVQAYRLVSPGSAGDATAHLIHEERQDDDDATHPLSSRLRRQALRAEGNLPTELGGGQPQPLPRGDELDVPTRSGRMESGHQPHPSLLPSLIGLNGGCHGLSRPSWMPTRAGSRSVALGQPSKGVPNRIG